MNTEIDMNKEARVEAKAEYGTEAWAHEVVAMAKRPTNTPEEEASLAEEVWAAVMSTR